MNPLSVLAPRFQKIDRVTLVRTRTSETITIDGVSEGVVVAFTASFSLIGGPRLQRRPWTDPLCGGFEIHSCGPDGARVGAFVIHADLGFGGLSRTD